ncbi:hypothetical protein Bca4012_056653 [Brassica carinata]|uniref:Uncharacterized protein n=1 Tax=Brassica carinata TaxID=52824 RepID=A0A8X7W3U0_BRACI|nr:hypothetical protein Bca52824_015790 [Brassica carinata]
MEEIWREKLRTYQSSLSIAKRRLEPEDSARNLDASVKDSDATDLEVVTSGPMGDPIV